MSIKNKPFCAHMIGFQILSSNQKFSFHNLKPLVCMPRTVQFFDIIKPKKKRAPNKSTKIPIMFYEKKEPKKLGIWYGKIIKLMWR